METINKKIQELKAKRESYLNMENFKHIADDDRYYNYLYNYVLSNVKDDSVIFDAIDERTFYSDDYAITGVFDIGGKLSCVIPERKTLFDEMICIHEITHLVNLLANKNNDSTAYREIIPYFNEYEYLKQIHEFYATHYEKYRENTAIKAANEMNNKNKKACLSYILAYEVLKSRKDKYNIESLNRTNAKTKKLEKDLIRKGYTI